MFLVLKILAPRYACSCNTPIARVGAGMETRSCDPNRAMLLAKMFCHSQGGYLFKVMLCCLFLTHHRLELNFSLRAVPDRPILPVACAQSRSTCSRKFTPTTRRATRLCCQTGRLRGRSARGVCFVSLWRMTRMWYACKSFKLIITKNLSQRSKSLGTRAASKRRRAKTWALQVALTGARPCFVKPDSVRLKKGLWNTMRLLHCSFLITQITLRPCKRVSGWCTETSRFSCCSKKG
mmetsp:Transcript_3772/g.8310  ORF Transcript_3772/g.8310 Transcript_3772/m.8310 type:complete len:236 (+) Transcript_3772:715-1422(+)